METQPIELRVPLDLRLVGVWLSELNGTNLSTLSPVSPRFTEEFTLRADGSADLRLPFSQEHSQAHLVSAPFQPTWETTTNGVLIIFIPIKPKPEFDITDWIREAIRYDVLAITQEMLTLSNRRHDGETITILHRVA